MVASHIVPFQSIVVEIIQNWETWFVITCCVQTENRQRKDDFIVIATYTEKIAPIISIIGKIIYHLVPLHGCPAVLGHNLRCGSNRRCFAVMLDLNHTKTHKVSNEFSRNFDKLCGKMWLLTDFSSAAWPEPSIFIWRLQIRAITTSKVTFASRSPNVTNITAC